MNTRRLKKKYKYLYPHKNLIFLTQNIIQNYILEKFLKTLHYIVESALIEMAR